MFAAIPDVVWHARDDEVSAEQKPRFRLSCLCFFAAVATANGAG